MDEHAEHDAFRKEEEEEMKAKLKSMWTPGMFDQFATNVRHTLLTYSV